MELKRCTKCVTSETHETITFDEKGVCNICHGHEIKQGQIDWASKKLELDELVETYRGKNDYDCLVPFSGGKDSTFTLYHLVKTYKLKPLVVRFDHGFLRPKIQENTTRVLRRLGVDFHHFTPNWKVVQRLMLQTFLGKGDFCWHCHTGIFSYPMWVAIRYNVPLIFWGEPSSEYTAYYGYDQTEEVDEKRFNRFVNLGINAQDMLVRLQGPITVGGGVSNLEDFRTLLKNGADKVSVNSAALDQPGLIRRAADMFGSQCVVLSIDFRRDADGTPRVWSDGAKTRHDWSPVDWARRGCELGVGEILLTSADRDGSNEGLDLEVTGEVSRAVPIPVIASGGCGLARHFIEGFQEGEAQAVASGTFFCLRDQNPIQTRAHIYNSGISVRMQR